MHFDVMDIMLPAFCECLVLVGIHSYLGIHVIKREVIFVDLALAQIAALGTTVGFLFGIMPKSTAAYWFSLAFTFAGAAIFSVSRLRHGRIPQEAVIGLVYALATALSILVIDKAPHGAEHIKEMLTGDLLWVKWSTIGKAAVVYSAVGVFHFLFRGRFLLISNDPERAYRQRIHVRWWDFLFYLSFGVVITHSVRTAGVLMVFVFLVVPAVASLLITDVLWKQLVIGWSMGVAVSVSGLYVSYAADLPSGPTVVSFYGIALLLVVTALYVRRSSSPWRAVRNVAAWLMACGAGAALLVGGGRWAAYQGQVDGENLHAHGPQGHSGAPDRAGAAHDAVLSAPARPGDLPAQDAAAGADGLEGLPADRLGGLPADQLDVVLAAHPDPRWLEQAFRASTDEWVRLQVVRKLTHIEPRAGLRLARMLKDDTRLPFVRAQAEALMDSAAEAGSGGGAAVPQAGR